MLRFPALFVVLLGVMAAPASAARVECGPRDAHTAVHGRLVRVYRVAGTAGDTVDYFACSGRHGRPVKLGGFYDSGSSSGTETGLAAAGGRYAAFAHAICWGDLRCTFTVHVVDVTRRATVQSAARDGDPIELVLSPQGLAGLSAFEDSAISPQPPDRYVLKLDATGAKRLDTGPDIGRLSVNGRRLRWRHGAVRRSAPLVRRRTCGPQGEDQSEVAHSASMRVYSADDGSLTTDYFACMFRGGKPLLLGEGFDGEGSAPPDYLTQFRFAGSDIGFVDDATYSSDPSFTVTVVDVRRRRVVHKFETSGTYGTTVLTFGGRGGVLVKTPAPRVVALDSRGETQLDSGEGVRRLRLRGDTLQWLHGQAPMSYRLR